MVPVGGSSQKLPLISLKINGLLPGNPRGRPLVHGGTFARGEYLIAYQGFFGKEVIVVTKRWQDWANMVVGLWLFVSPWVLQYETMEAAAWNAYVLGTAIVVFAAVAVYMPKAWEELFNMAFGVWLVICPYVLGFASQTTVAINVVVVGALTVAFATWAMFSDAEFDKWWHEHHFF